MLIANECMKIHSRRFFWMISLVLLCIVIMSALFGDYEGSETGFGDMLIANTNINILITFFMVIEASRIVAAEFSTGTIRMLLIRPVSRTKIMYAKFFAICLLTAALMVGLLLTSFISGYFILPLGSIRGPELLSSYLLNYVFAFIAISLAFMMSAVSRSSATATALSIALTFGSFIGNALFMFGGNNIAKYFWLINADLSPYFGDNEPILDGMTLSFSITVDLIYLLLFHAVAWGVFVRRDV